MDLNSILFSDSDSDLELLEQILDWDSDEEHEQRVNCCKSYTRINYPQSLNEAEFTYRFRLNKVAVESLLTEIMPFILVKSRRNNGVAPLHQLLLALRFYALGAVLLSVADFVGVSKSTASRIIQTISGAIAKLYCKYIYMHQNSAQKFYSISKFPQVLGAIDCTHIRIQSPKNIIGEEFKNRKGYFSINVQAVCDAELKFMNVVARWPGSTHDATIFNNSVLKAQCDKGTYGNRWLIGDSAYPNRPYLLTPILNPSTENEQRYNEAHIRTRNTNDSTFGAWKRRFPVVALTLRLSLQNIQNIILATAVLHNICRDYNIDEVSPEVYIPDSENIEVFCFEVEDISSRAEIISQYFSS